MAWRNEHLREAIRVLRLRGITQQTLANAVHTSRPYVSRAMGNYERHGATWERIKAALIARECADVVALLELVPSRPRQKTECRRQRSSVGESPIVLTRTAVPVDDTFTVRKFNAWSQRSA